MQDAFNYMATDPNPFGVCMINTAKEMFMMFEPATQAWRSQLPFFVFSIPAMFRSPRISSYLSDDQPIQIASRGENVAPPNPPGLQSLQSRAAAGEDGLPYPSKEHSITSNQTGTALLSLLGFLSTGCTPQNQKQAPPPSPIEFAGASDDASLPSLPTWKWQINFKNTANQRDIGSTKSPESSNVIYMGTKSPAKELPQSKQSCKCFWNLKIASPNAFTNESTSVIEYFTVRIWKNPVLNAAKLQHGPTRIPVHEVIPADDFLKASLLTTNGPKGSTNDINSEWLPGQAAKTL